MPEHPWGVAARGTISIMRLALPPVASLPCPACAGAPSPAPPAPGDHAVLAQPAGAPEAGPLGREVEQERKADASRYREPPSEPRTCTPGAPAPCDPPHGFHPLGDGP